MSMCDRILALSVSVKVHALHLLRGTVAACRVYVDPHMRRMIWEMVAKMQPVLSGTVVVTTGTETEERRREITPVTAVKRQYRVKTLRRASPMRQVHLFR